MKTLHICIEREKMKIAVISVTDAGGKIAAKLAEVFSLDLYSKNNCSFNLKSITEMVMSKYRKIVFISSTGIAVRAIAPFIESKDRDPAVVVIDSSGKFAISLLSGHLGGANELTIKLADVLKAVPVITTATDNMGIKAPDVLARDNDLVIDSLKDAKYLAALLVKGEKVGFVDEDNLIDVPYGYSLQLGNVQGILCITHKKNLNMESVRTLKLVRKNIVLGIGCRKGFKPSDMIDKVVELLEDNNIDERAIKYIATAEIKAQEKAIIELAQYFKCKVRIFSLEEIKSVQNNYKGSDFVEESVGVRAVCEPCVELTGSDLVTEKIKSGGMTLCIGKLKYDKRMC